MNAQTKIGGHVYTAITAITAEMAKEGIGKTRSNQQQGYKFRGIDDVYNSLSSKLAQHKLCILPRIVAREVAERQNKSGNALFYVTVEAEFDFVSAEDGSVHTVRTFGEAMDSGDKATNKAMSAAYKYAAFQTFCIPTEGDNDADATTHEVVAAAPVNFAALHEQLAAELNGADHARIEKVKVANKTAIQRAAKEAPKIYEAIGKLFADARANLTKEKEPA